jgi:sensor histidine kinase YesM
VSHHRRLKWGLIFGIWTLIGLMDATQVYLRPSYVDDTPRQSWLGALVIGVSDWYLLALLTPVIFYLARRFSFKQHRGRDIAVHLLAAVCCALLVLAVVTLIVHAVAAPFPRYPTLEQLFRAFFFTKFQFYLLTYWVLVGISHALDYYQKYRERELTASQLEARLAQAQLQVLKMQLQPHFLFNTLHAISALMHQDVELADGMIARLGELLRSALDSVGTQEVPLSQELDFIKPYLEIEQARLGPRLSVQLEIDPEVLDVRVPNLLLQPLVENAIRHGIVPYTEPGCIQIRARREGEFLRLQIADNGAGLSSNYVEGVGVCNTRARLRHLYGDAHDFALKKRAGGGVEVEVVLPFRNHPEAQDCNGKGGNSANPNLDRG